MRPWGRRQRLTSRCLSMKLILSWLMPLVERLSGTAALLASSTASPSPAVRKWYHMILLYITSFTLCFGQQPFLAVPADKVIVALAFDWVGDMLYMLRLDVQSMFLELYRVSIFDSSSLINVFPPNLGRMATMESSFQMVMNPFAGYAVCVCCVCVCVCHHFLCFCVCVKRSVSGFSESVELKFKHITSAGFCTGLRPHLLAPPPSHSSIYDQAVKQSSESWAGVGGRGWL